MTEWLIGDLYDDILWAVTVWQDVDDDVGDQVLVMVVIAGKITVWDQVLVMVVIAGKITVWLQGNPIQDHEVGPFVIREWSSLVSKSERILSRDHDHNMYDMLLHC